MNHYELESGRILKILDDAIFTLQILKYIPMLLDNDGKVLRKFLNKTECDFITMVCENNILDRENIYERSDLLLINNMLERIMQENLTKPRKNIMSIESYEIHVSYAVDILLACQPLIDHLLKHRAKKIDPLVNAFVMAMVKLRNIVQIRLETSAVYQIKRDNDLKTAYRASMMLSDNIQELEDKLEKQRLELEEETDKKQAILNDFSRQISELKKKSDRQIEKIVFDSETQMMKDYNKSIERQAELSEMADETTRQYEQVLEHHLKVEKVLRTKRNKVLAQLGNWVTKYDTDMGDKQAEYDELDNTLNEMKKEQDLLEDQFLEQEKEYMALMKEKEAEEKKIREEKAWIFLQNRSARTIQRAWLAYKARKLARKLAKKKGRGRKKGSGKKKEKKKEEHTSLKGGPNPNALIAKKFNSELFADIKEKDAFDQKNVGVDLTKD